MPFPRQALELVGNLGRAPDAKYTPSGTMVTQFSMAVTRQWKKDGQESKETIWVSVTVWDKLAEMCQHLQKGQQVLVKGYLKPDAANGSPRIWTRTDGTPGASYELTAQEVWLSVFNGSSAGQVEPGSAPSAPDDFDIPF